MDQNHKSNSTLISDWEERTLCSDENCIGIIGPDGCCKECGKQFDPTNAKRQESEVLDSTESDWLSDESSTDTDDQEAFEPGADWQNRQLCSDENCIGVIGTDGCCKECGKPAKNK